MMWPRTDLINLLGVSHPIVQAPMSGLGGPALVAAVSNAGALGPLSCVALSEEAERDQLGKLRQACNQPFNLNFFMHPAPNSDARTAERVRHRLARYFAEFGLGAVPEPT